MPARPTRSLLLETAARLFQEHGYHGTGLNLILSESGAPKGSLYFHFPGGKAQLAKEVVNRASEEMCVGLQALLDSAPDPATGASRLAHLLAETLIASDFRIGCPVAPFVVGSEKGTLEDAVSGAFHDWQKLIADRLVRQGYKRKRAGELATFALSAVEGAVLLSKAHRDVTPLRQVARELSQVFARQP